MLKSDMQTRDRVREERRIEELLNASRAASSGYLVASTLNGGTIGQVLTKNSATARDWSWQPAGGGGASWTEAEIDFGLQPVYEAAFTITDAAIIDATMKVQVLPCGKAATGRTADDWQWDGAVFAANPGAGSATVYATFMPGPIVGKRRIQYSVGA